MQVIAEAATRREIQILRPHIFSSELWNPRSFHEDPRSGCLRPTLAVANCIVALLWHGSHFALLVLHLDIGRRPLLIQFIDPKRNKFNEWAPKWMLPRFHHCCATILNIDEARLRTVPFQAMTCGKQDDGVSCGAFALGTLALLGERLETQCFLTNENIVNFRLSLYEWCRKKYGRSPIPMPVVIPMKNGRTGTYFPEAVAFYGLYLCYFICEILLERVTGLTFKPASSTSKPTLQPVAVNKL